MFIFIILNYSLKWRSSDLSSIVIECLLAFKCDTCSSCYCFRHFKWFPSVTILWTHCRSWLWRLLVLVSTSRALCEGHYLLLFSLHFPSLISLCLPQSTLSFGFASALEMQREQMATRIMKRPMVDVLEMKFIGNVLEECDVVVWLLFCCTGCFRDMIFFMDLD